MLGKEVGCGTNAHCTSAHEADGLHAGVWEFRVASKLGETFHSILSRGGLRRVDKEFFNWLPDR